MKKGERIGLPSPFASAVYHTGIDQNSKTATKTIIKIVFMVNFLIVVF